MKIIFILIQLFLIQSICLSQTSETYITAIIAKYEIADKKLNIIYKNALFKLKGKNEKLTLKNLQIKWIKIRDDKSNTDDFIGSRITRIEIYYNCLTEITNERITYLKKYKP